MRTFFKVLGIVVLILCTLILSVQIGFSLKSKKTFKPQDFTIAEDVTQASIEMGQRMYTVRNGCVDCHGDDLAGVKIMENGAMGSLYGANITPAALHSWSDEEIARTIRYEVHKSGHSLRFMPVFDYENLSKEDVAFLVTYIRSVPPIEKPSHTNTFGPVAKALSVFGQMPVMFPAHIVDQTQGFQEKPPEGATVEFGKYLAHSCTGCHGSEFRGGKIPDGDPAWPAAADIRFEASTLWNEEKFYRVLETRTSPITELALRFPMPVNQLKGINSVEKRHFGSACIL